MEDINRNLEKVEKIFALANIGFTKQIYAVQNPIKCYIAFEATLPELSAIVQNCEAEGVHVIMVDVSGEGEANWENPLTTKRRLWLRIS